MTCRHHGDHPARIVGHPERQIPVQERRAVLVEIERGLGNGIFRIGHLGKFTGLLKGSGLAVGFHDCPCQEIDHRRMDIFAHQYDVAGCNENHVGGWNDPLKIDDTARQHQSDKIRKNASESLGFRKAHGASTGVCQQGAENWRIQSKGKKHGIDRAVIDCVDGLCAERPTSVVFSSVTPLISRIFSGYRPLAAAFRP